VNTSSIFGLNGYPGWSLYVATKHAVTGMTKAAALDYAKKNIRVNAVGSGPVERPLLAKGTGGDPHSYAAFVPMGGSANRARSLTPWCGFCLRRPATSPATRCPWMAAFVRSNG
jgi:NAD(P)-dependent dehydrogenase (short-subunit alcohol dehydrogenase family)